MRLNTVFFSIVTAAVATCARGQIGPPVGARVPDFQAVDQTGASRSLASILGSQGALLVFYRSADW
jgi:hypothetical protein